MPPIPFPFPLSIGTDICKISRIHKILSGPRAVRFIRLILTDEERKTPRPYVTAVLSQYWDKISDPAVAESVKFRALRDSAQFLAGRFAAKEAAIKAHPHRNLTFHKIIIKGEVALSDYSYNDDRGGTGAIGVAQKNPQQFTRDNNGNNQLSKIGVDPALLEKEALYAEAERKNHTLFISVTSPPVCIIKGDPEKGIEDQIAMVSISHDTDYATATCLGWHHGENNGGSSSGNDLSWPERRAMEREWKVEREAAKRTVQSQGRLRIPMSSSEIREQLGKERAEEIQEGEEDPEELERKRQISKEWNKELGPRSVIEMKRRKKMWGDPQKEEEKSRLGSSSKQGDDFYASEELWDEFKKLMEPETKLDRQQQQGPKEGGSQRK